MSIKHFKRAAVSACVGVGLMLGSVTAQAGRWTLELAVQRSLEQAPERQAAQAEVLVRRGGLQQANVWPNPTVEVSGDNSLGKEDGQGGGSITRISLSQRLPVTGRLDWQRKQAQSALMQGEADVGQQSLTLEHSAAQTFHGLQLNRALLDLSEQQMKSAEEIQRIGVRREQAGDLSRLERLRLDVVRETAKQRVESAEGEYAESLSHFQTLLNVTEVAPTLVALEAHPLRPLLTDLEGQLISHPALVAARQKVEAAGFGVGVARANRFADPELWLATEKSFLGGSRQTVTAVGLAFTLPLWDSNKGNVDAAQASREKAQFELEALNRHLGNQVRLTHLHLGHLNEQSEEFRLNVLNPTQEIFELTRKGFSAGEVEVLNLVDAVETYFGARARYLELLQQAWLEAAELRLAAGVSLQPSISQISKGAQP